MYNYWENSLVFVLVHKTSNPIEIESPGHSGFEANLKMTDRDFLAQFVNKFYTYSTPRAKTDKLEEPVNRELNVTRS